MLIIDGHCDSILAEFHAQRSLRDRSAEGHIDIPRLREAGIGGQFFALFTEDQFVERAYEHTNELLSRVNTLLEQDSRVVGATQASDIEQAAQQDQTAVVLAIEGAEPIERDIRRVETFYHSGVRLMTLTWNRRNAVARGIGTEGTDGLSGFGAEVVAAMEELGMIVDVSHLSDTSLNDVLKRVTCPVVASHSNARAIHDHPRNLWDEQLQAIAATGGLIGLTFPGVFIDGDPKKVTLDRALEHLEHMIEVAGADHVGIGSDFDGFTAPYGLVMPDCTGLPQVAEALRRRGYPAETVEKIMGRNWLRVLRAMHTGTD
ncbi:MAG: membrane dipeptidase [Spirochaetaceae bacterium]|nr:MAG: membrane dipeptidase [Spirochaetaceae bacterium]